MEFHKDPFLGPSSSILSNMTGFSDHSYAYDTRIYLELPPNNCGPAVVQNWIQLNWTMKNLRVVLDYLTYESCEDH